MITLVCGGRNYQQYANLCESLGAVAVITAIVHGDAPGADTLAGVYAKSKGIPEIIIPAPWSFYDHAAGPIRNQWMLDLITIEYCVAFPGNTGTADMVARCERENIPVWRPYG